MARNPSSPTLLLVLLLPLSSAVFAAQFAHSALSEEQPQPSWAALFEPITAEAFFRDIYTTQPWRSRVDSSRLRPLLPAANLSHIVNSFARAGAVARGLQVRRGTRFFQQNGVLLQNWGMGAASPR